MSKIKIILYNDMADEKIVRSYQINNKKLTNTLMKSLNDTPEHIIKKTKENKEFLKNNAHILGAQLMLQNEIESNKIWKKYERNRTNN